MYTNIMFIRAHAHLCRNVTSSLEDEVGQDEWNSLSEIQRIGQRLPESCKLHPALEVYVIDEHDPLQRVGLIGELGVRVCTPLIPAGCLCWLSVRVHQKSAAKRVRVTFVAISSAQHMLGLSVASSAVLCQVCASHAYPSRPQCSSGRMFPPAAC